MVATRQQRLDHLSSEHYWFKRKYRQWKIRLLRHKLAYRKYCEHVAKRQWLNKLNSFPERIRAEREYVGFGYRALYEPLIVTKLDTKDLFDPFHPTGGYINLREHDESQSAPCPTCVYYDDETQRWSGTGGTCPDHEYI